MSDELQELDLRRLPEGEVGTNVLLRCKTFHAEGAFKIGDDVVLEAESIWLGDGATIGQGARIRAIDGRTAVFKMGDRSLIDEYSNVMVPHFECGDYTRIFRDALISGYKPTTLGHNCWVGQGVILNCAETLTIGNNVRMGGGQVWTHVASGELLEGSRFYNEAPVVIEDDVWLMGFGHLISPGLTLGRGTVVMAGSVVTHSTTPYHTYSGMPAKDITDRLPGWNTLSADEKWAMLHGFVDDFVIANPSARDGVVTVEDDAAFQAALGRSNASLIFAKEVRVWPSRSDCSHSVFDLATKAYLKQRSPLEVAWMNFAIGHRARFLPR